MVNDASVRRSRYPVPYDDQTPADRAMLYFLEARATNMDSRVLKLLGNNYLDELYAMFGGFGPDGRTRQGMLLAAASATSRGARSKVKAAMDAIDGSDARLAAWSDALPDDVFEFMPPGRMPSDATDMDILALHETAAHDMELLDDTHAWWQGVGAAKSTGVQFEDVTGGGNAEEFDDPLAGAYDDNGDDHQDHEDGGDYMATHEQHPLARYDSATQFGITRAGLQG